ncbi:MAG TPA: DUF3761 domain-containing protein [Usitatibacter sp.]|nr:DUF3761 domain-containing protein [Usitatibacter sp.]
MKKLLVPLTIALAAAAAGAWAKAPAGATGECKDGSYTTAAQKEGACSSHGGVKKWLAKEDKSAKAEKPSDTAPKTDRPKVAASTNAAKPADATGECKDGSFTTSPSKSGACSGHKGVKNWYGKDAMSPGAAEPKGSGAASSRPSTMNAPSTTSAPGTGSSRSSPAPSGGKTAAAGGGAGQVWVNTDSKVYHCEKDSLYGKTKQGEYMSEAQAKASGARPSRGKECS